MYGDDRPFYSPGSIDFGVDSHHSYSSDATEYSLNEMKYNQFYSGSQQSNISDEYHYNDIGRDFFKLPGFHQTFGSTEIGRFSQHDEIFEQIQNQVLSSSPIDPPPNTNSPLSSLIEQHNSIQNESNQIQQNQNSRKTKPRSQRKTKSNKSIKTTNSKHTHPPSNTPANYNIEPETPNPYSNMSEPCSKYWNNQSSYYDRSYLPASHPTYTYNNHNCTNYTSPSSLHNQSCMCHNNYGSRYHHQHHSSSNPYNSYSPNYFYYENPYYSTQYHHNYHSNYWGYNCQTV